MMRLSVVPVFGMVVAIPALGQDCMWSPRGTSPGLFMPTTVYHAALGSVVEVDGDGSLARWNGSTWTSLAPAAFSGRYGTAVCYDSMRNRIVLFGGYIGTPVFTTFGQTWEWDGSQWTLIPGAGPPAFATVRVMAFDAARGRSVMIYANSGSNQTQTWTWDGAAWVQVVTPGPLGRFDHSMTYDSARQRVVLYGGVTTTNPQALLQDVWEFDGASWTRRADGPGARHRHAMGYDPTRARIIMHGVVGPHVYPLVVETWDYEPVGDVWTLRAVGGPELYRRELTFDIPRQRAVGWQVLEQIWEWNQGAAISPISITQQPVRQDVPVGGRAEFLVGAFCTGPMTYQWMRNGAPLSNGAGISGANAPTLVIDPVAPAHLGLYSVAISNGCIPVQSSGAELYVLGKPCYANCDGSTVSPILTANDFQCFVNRFAAGDTYANCDGSTGTPALTHSDFHCFASAFASGCF